MTPRIEQEFRRQVISYTGLWMGLLVFISMLPRYLIAPIQSATMIINLSVGAVMLALPLLIRRKFSTSVCGNLLVICFQVIGLNSGFWNGGMMAPATVLFVIAPIIGFFCTGKRGAQLAIGLSIVNMSVLVVADGQHLVHAVNSPERYVYYKALIEFFAAIAVYAIGAAYEHGRRISGKMVAEISVKAAHSSKMSSLGEMAAGMAHEINNPLTIINGKVYRILKMMESGANLDRAKIAEDLRKTSDTVQRISKIVKGLSSYSRNSERDEMITARLVTIFDDTVDLCRARFEHHQIEVRVICAPEIELLCRPSQISQVLMNLLINAFDAVVELPQKWIELKAVLTGTSLEITVTDSGHGISKEVQDKIFQPFYTTKAVGKGTGLGLSISSGICQEHHGELKYDPTFANTRFIIELPRYQPQTSANAA